MDRIGNPFFQIPEPKLVKYQDIPLGGYFTHNGEEFVRVLGGHRRVKGRHPLIPYQFHPEARVTQ